MLKPAARERTLECDIMGDRDGPATKDMKCRGEGEAYRASEDRKSLYSQDKH